MNDSREQPEHDPLSPQDAEALDRLVQRGFESPAHDGADADRERAILQVLREIGRAHV